LAATGDLRPGQPGGIGELFYSLFRLTAFTVLATIINTNIFFVNCFIFIVHRQAGAGWIWGRGMATGSGGYKRVETAKAGLSGGEFCWLDTPALTIGFFSGMNTIGRGEVKPAKHPKLP